MIFRNGGRLRENEHWTYDDNDLEIVDEFNYLGMLFFYTGKFARTQKHLAEQGRKALFSIYSKIKEFDFNFETMLSIFDTYVNSILSYASEYGDFTTDLMLSVFI